MQSKANTVDDYISELPSERQYPINKLRAIIKKNLPKGFQESMSYGMIGYVIPHTLYAPGYHCNPKLPLPFLNIASQKNFIAIYHMGIYADSNLLSWFQKAHAEISTKKLDMGKSCIRYKKPDDIPYELIGQLASKMAPKQWIELYEKSFIK